MGRNCCFKKNMVTDEEKKDEEKNDEKKCDEEKTPELKIDIEKIYNETMNEEKVDRIPDRRNLIHVVEFKKATNQATIKKAEYNIPGHGRQSVEKRDEEKPRWRI